MRCEKKPATKKTISTTKEAEKKAEGEREREPLKDFIAFLFLYPYVILHDGIIENAKLEQYPPIALCSMKLHT